MQNRLSCFRTEDATSPRGRATVRMEGSSRWRTSIRLAAPSSSTLSRRSDRILRSHFLILGLTNVSEFLLQTVKIVHSQQNEANQNSVFVGLLKKFSFAKFSGRSFTFALVLTSVVFINGLIAA